MQLQTTLVISNANCSLKTNQRSQFYHFSHSLKVINKTDNQIMSILTKQASVVQSLFKMTKEVKSKEDSINKTIDRPMTAERKAQTKMNVFQAQKNHNIFEEPNPKQNSQYFNEDDGVLQHLYDRYFTTSPANTKSLSLTSSNTFSLKQCRTRQQLPLQQRSQNFPTPKCFILFGFSINVNQIELFHERHPQLNIRIKIYKYNDNQFYKEIIIKNLFEQPYEKKTKKYQSIIEKLQGVDLLDCEEVTFVVSVWDGSSREKDKCSEVNQFSKSRTQSHMYFFPNINALKSDQEKRQQKTQLTQGCSNILTNRQKQTCNQAHQDSNQTYDRCNQAHHGATYPQHPTSSQPTPQISLTSLRKSHQNFRILQVLQYYLKLQCHSDHIMITLNQSLVIKQFLDLIYLTGMSEFRIFIDHERKNFNQMGKSIARSILCRNSPKQNQDKSHDHQDNSINHLYSSADTPLTNVSRIFTSDITSEQEFISIDGHLIINDQFLSKLSELKLPEPWLDSEDFRQQKRNMYKMKIEEHTLNKEIKLMKTTFVDNINHLNGLIGVEKVTYDQISIESLKQIKNAKIRQNTQEVKQLANICQNLQIRSDQLKAKKKQFQKQKTLKDEHQKQNLSQLRKDISDIQKQLNLNKNQLNAIYHSEYRQQDLDRSALSTNKMSVSHIKQSRISTSKVLKAQPPNNSEAMNHSQSLLHAQSFLVARKSSQMISKYGPVLQQLRKQKYETILKQQMTKCEFEAEKQYEKFKEEYAKASKQLRLFLNDCD